MVRLQCEANRQYKLTLPKAIIEALGWKKGDDVDIRLTSDGISLALKPKILIQPEIREEITREIQNQIREEINGEESNG